MSGKDDGGPAFPLQEQLQSGPNGGAWLSPGQPGLSLRDYFAGQALAGLMPPYGLSPDGVRDLVGVVADPDLFDVFARHAYSMADAMLAERAK